MSGRWRGCSYFCCDPCSGLFKFSKRCPMAIPRVKSCASLKAGTVALLCSTLVCSILYPFIDKIEGITEKWTVESVCVLILMLSVSLCGLYGEYQNKHNFLLPYLGYLVFQSIACIVFAIKLLLHFNNTLLGIFSILFSVLTVYFWFVVYSYYRDVREKNMGHSTSAT